MQERRERRVSEEEKEEKEKKNGTDMEMGEKIIKEEEEEVCKE